MQLVLSKYVKSTSLIKTKTHKNGNDRISFHKDFKQ